MRLSIHGSVRAQTRELRVGLQGSERPDFALLRTLKASDEELLVPLAAARETSAGRHVLTYDLSGLRSLRKCLHGEVEGQLELSSALRDVVGVLEWCAHTTRGKGLVLFDPRSVYVSEGGRLRFVLVPVRDYARAEERSPVVVLQALANLRHARRRSPNERELARRLSEFLGAEGEAFSLNRLRTFVRTECTGVVGVVAAGNVREGGLRGRGRGSVPRPPAMREGSVETHAPSRCLLRNVSTGAEVALSPYVSYELGRATSCDVRLEGCPKVSRRHAAIRCEERVVRIEDLGSTNGTYVAGRRIVPHAESEVAYGQTFYLSDQEFYVGRDMA